MGFSPGVSGLGNPGEKAYAIGVKTHFLDSNALHNPKAPFFHCVTRVTETLEPLQPPNAKALGQRIEPNLEFTHTFHNQVLQRSLSETVFAIPEIKVLSPDNVNDLCFSACFLHRIMAHVKQTIDKRAIHLDLRKIKLP